jgi:dihydrofolate reductase
MMSCVGPDIVEDIRRSTLTSTLLVHGLADKVLLVVYPILLGTGKRCFASGTPARAFEVVSTNGMPPGIILSAYKVAEPLKAG